MSDIPERTEVVITDIDLSMGTVFKLMLKCFIAALPAFIVAGIVLFMLGSLLISMIIASLRETFPLFVP